MSIAFGERLSELLVLGVFQGSILFKRKRMYAPKMHTNSSTWHRGDKWLMANKKKNACHSYRLQWIDAGSPETFEAWLKANGILVGLHGERDDE
jgi:hypothetical protein